MNFLKSQISQIPNFKPLPVFCSSTAWFVSDLVRILKHRFSLGATSISLLFTILSLYCIFCVAEAVRKNRLFVSATDKAIEDPAKDWFRFAADRSGGRKVRRAAKAAKSAANMSDILDTSEPASNVSEPDD